MCWVPTYSRAHIKFHLLKTTLLQQNFARHLSSSEVTVALRPFYFAVHPDLFQQHPQERDTNENSLKQLNHYIETLLNAKPVRPARVQFYVRKPKPFEKQFQVVSIPLSQKDIHGALQTILSSCSLSTKYVDGLSKIPAQFIKQGIAVKSKLTYILNVFSKLSN